MPSGAVDNEWNVKKQASRSCSVGPVGIRYGIPGYRNPTGWQKITTLVCL